MKLYDPFQIQTLIPKLIECWLSGENDALLALDTTQNNNNNSTFSRDQCLVGKHDSIIIICQT